MASEGTSGDGSRDAPRVVILGGGFGGLWAARALRKAPVEVMLFDRQNHHLFQPLLYQVATASLSPADVSAPLRRILADQKNTTVLLGEAIDVDAKNRVVSFKDHQEVSYDYLIVATGARFTYFGNDQWAPLAPGLKTVRDALTIRQRFLKAFEEAERIDDPDTRRRKLTFVVVGGGPTGVEMAGAMAEIARRAMPKDFRRIDTRSSRIMLLEGLDRLLPAYPQPLNDRTKRDLEALGVDVRLESLVTDVDETGVMVGKERIETENVVWAAGVGGEALGRTIGEKVGLEIGKDGRVPVNDDLTIDGADDVFVVGDLARHKDPKTGEETPGVAPGAMQMGKYAAGIVRKEAMARARGDAPPQRRPFRYLDKGQLSTIGRARAVGVIRGARIAGLLAWLLWLGVHIFFLIGFANRLRVLLSWAYAYFTFQHGSRLIIEAAEADPRVPAKRIAPEEDERRERGEEGARGAREEQPASA